MQTLTRIPHAHDARRFAWKRAYPIWLNIQLWLLILLGCDIALRRLF